MKVIKFVRTVFPLILATTLSSVVMSALSSCKLDNGEDSSAIYSYSQSGNSSGSGEEFSANTSSNQGENSSSSDVGDSADSSSENDDAIFQAAVSVAQSLASRAAEGNFTMTNGAVAISFDGDKAFFDYDDSSEDTYYALEGNTLVQYAMNDGGNWVKDYANDAQQTPAEMIEMVATALEGVLWNSYSSASGQLVGQVEFGGKDCVVVADLDSEEFSLSADGQTNSISQIGTTSVSLPENFKDNTAESEKLYSNGKWNVALLKETIAKWIAENDYLSTYAYATAGTVVLDDVLYVDYDENSGLLFGVMKKSSGVDMFEEYKINDDILQNIISGDISTADELISALEAQTRPIKSAGTLGFAYECSTVEGTEDYDLWGQAESVLARISQTGVQSTSINDEGSKITDYDNSTILEVFKTENSLGGYGSDLGYREGWNLYIVLQKEDGQIELIETQVLSKNGYESHLLDDANSSNWLVNSLTVKNDNILTDNLQNFTGANTNNVAVASMQLKK